MLLLIKILFDKDYYTPTKEVHRDLSLLQVQELSNYTV